MKNPNVMLETCLGGDSAVATERPTSMALRKSTEGHSVFAATNGDFYFFIDPVEIGIPRSGQFTANECITNPVAGLLLFWIKITVLISIGLIFREQ
ncbi:hypothetical protein NXY31_13420 [Bacteroides salyersiae]|nr:hypothetical protein [Bacteroides salyersiae]